MPATVDSHLNASGRISLSLLAEHILTTTANEFATFLCHRPVLAGAAIRRGCFARRKCEHDQTLMFYSHEEHESAAPSTAELDKVVYPLVKCRPLTNHIESFTIGRLSSNDLVIADFAVSKHHATLELKFGQYILIDCQSTNGTCVNNKPLITQEHSLQDGDVIAFARYEFVFFNPESLYYQLVHWQG
ncbi:FHA domain-containing protein [Thiospirillum jenense]|nr:FHA domain-containing protein [Thiospirillum jenense]